MGTIQITRGGIYGTVNKSQTVNKAVQSIMVLDEENVPDSTTDKEFVAAIDFSNLKALFFFSDAAVTIETEDGTTPTDTIVLAAGECLTWLEGETDIITADVTKLFITNASGGPAKVTMVAGYDLP